MVFLKNCGCEGKEHIGIAESSIVPSDHLDSDIIPKEATPRNVEPEQGGQTRYGSPVDGFVAVTTLVKPSWEKFSFC